MKQTDVRRLPNDAVKNVRSPAEEGHSASTGQTQETPWYGSYWTVSAVVFTLACLAYAVSLRGPYLFDDLMLPFSSPFFSGEPLLTWLRGVRPVLMLSYWMNYQSSGAETFAYHLTNVALHAFNSVLVFGICKRLFTLVIPDSRRAFTASAFGCSVFLLHPLQTESVAYVAGRSEVLSAAFVLLAWLIFVRRIGSPVTVLQA